MSKIMLFINNAPSEQLFTFAGAAVVWFLGGYILKRKLRQRLASEDIKLEEDIRFEDIKLKEWGIFATLAVITIGLVILGVNIPDLITR